MEKRGNSNVKEEKKKDKTNAAVIIEKCVFAQCLCTHNRKTAGTTQDDKRKLKCDKGAENGNVQQQNTKLLERRKLAEMEIGIISFTEQVTSRFG